MASTGDRATRVLLCALGALAVILVSGAVVVHAPSSPAANLREVCHSILSQQPGVYGSRGPRIAVIGDSYTEGYLLDDPSRAWPAYLASAAHVRVAADGIGGSGYTSGMNSCPVSYQTRTARALRSHPDLVILEGGLNDLDHSDEKIRGSVERTLAGLHGTRVVMLGPTAAPARRADALRVDRLLARIAHRAGVTYVSTAGWRLPFLEDQVHLTEAGHRRFGGLVAAAVTR